VCLFSACLFAKDARADRVGFQFTGALQVPGTGNTTLFNTSVPKNSPVTGTFSYDTSDGAAGSNPAIFEQHIEGGFTLNINNGSIRLSASDFRVIVTNDFQRQAPAETVDTLDVRFDTRFSPAPRAPLVNDSTWSGIAFMTVDLSWPSATIGDSQLTAELPLTTGFAPGAYSSVSNTASSIKLFYISSVSSISRSPGDYNVDGKFDLSDFQEWRNAYGTAASYADGNQDGEVNAADYVVWRNGLGPVGALAVANVPEPNIALTAAVGILAIALGIRGLRM